MSIIKDVQDDDFFRASREVVEEESLSWKAKGIHSYVMSRPPGWTVYRKQLQEISTDGRTSLQSGLKELREAGYAKLVRLRNQDTQQFLGERYLIRGRLAADWSESGRITVEEDGEEKVIDVDFLPKNSPGEQESPRTENPTAGDSDRRETRSHNNEEDNSDEYSNNSANAEEDEPPEGSQDESSSNPPAEQGTPSNPKVETGDDPDTENSDKQETTLPDERNDEFVEALEHWWSGTGEHPYSPDLIQKKLDACPNRNNQNGVCVQALLDLFGTEETNAGDIWGRVAKLTQDIESIAGQTGQGPELFLMSLIRLTNPPPSHVQRADLRPFENEPRQEALVGDVLDYLTATIEDKKKEAQKQNGRQKARSEADKELEQKKREQRERRKAEDKLYKGLGDGVVEDE